MQQIQNNPYRTLGLLVGASAREQERQVRRLKQLIEAEQELPEDFSFPVLGTMNRTVNSVTDAASKLNLNADRMNAALFWFYNGSHTDEPVFDSMKESKEAAKEAVKIWMKLIESNEVTSRNCSAFQNLSNALLNSAIKEQAVNQASLEKAINLKLKFLESDFTSDFIKLSTDETYKTTKEELQKYFLNQVHAEIVKAGGVSSDAFLEIINKQAFSAKQDYLKGFVQKPIEAIEKRVEDSRAKRKANPSNANSIGANLFESTKESLSLLKTILGASDLKYSTISDKVADEVLQCGIDYFKKFKDSNTDPASVTMDLFRKSKTLAIGNIAKQRCQENTENLEEWIDEKPEREKQSKVIFDLEKIKDLIDEYENKSETVSNAKLLLSSAMPHLNQIKGVLGGTDELYLGLSSRVASDAQGMLVSEINKLQEKFSNTYDNATKVAALLLLKQRTNEAWEVTNSIGGMDLRQDFRTRFTTNRNSLSNLKTQLSSVGNNAGKSSSGSSGCYIATMAYGDYNHPQVLILREFRDEVLAKYTLGRKFIRLYYKYSPKLVTVLKNQKTTNRFIRTTLNQFIKLIK